MQESPYPLIPVDEALALVLAQADQLPTEKVPPAAALGRTLVESIRAATPLPPFRASTKDGYAVVASTERASGCWSAKSPPGRRRTLGWFPGTVAYITTGVHRYRKVRTRWLWSSRLI